MLHPLDLTWLESGADGRWMETPDQAVRALEDVLRGVKTSGAILVGGLGDRRETIEAALTSVSTDRAVFRLHGSAFASTTPYGALAILLAGLEDTPPGHPHGMMRLLSDYLCPPGAEPAIVILSQPHQIDQGTVTVLAQLAQLRHITLVVHCERSTEVPVDMAALRRLGTLSGISIWPLSPTAGHRLVEETAGGPVSHFATTVLWTHSGGSVQQLRQLTSDCIVSGKIVRNGAVWVLAPGPLPQPAVGVDPFAMLRSLPPRQRALLEMLAICGPMRVGDLIHTGYAAELDELEESGAVQIRSEHSGRMAHMSSVRAAETMAAIEPDRRRELTSTLEVLDPGYLSVLRAVQDFVAIGSPREAIKLFNDRGRTTGHRIQAASATGRLHLAWAEARVRCLAGDVTGAATVLRDSTERDSAVLRVQAAVLAIFRGRPREVFELLDALPEEHQPESATEDSAVFTRESIRFRAQAIRAEAMALSDDQLGALRIVASLDHELALFSHQGILDDVINPFERALVAESLMTVLVTCGHIERARDVASTVIAGRHGNPYAVQYADLVLALTDVMGGEQEQAGRRAAVAVAQLERLGHSRDLETALAIKAYCTVASEGLRDHPAPELMDSARVLETYAREPGSGREGQPLGRLGWMAEILQCWSMGQLHSPKARTARMVALADRAAAEGLYAVELAAVSGAFLCGEPWLARRLAEAAESTQTTVSTPHRLLAGAVLDKDPDRLFLALEQLVGAGFVGHLQENGTPLLQELSPPQLRRLMDLAEARRRSDTATDESDGDPAWMADLTRREKEISRLVVAGKTNAMIARITGISIRTVEGHLYQIYAKLHLKGRAELTRLASIHTPERHRP